ncbi:acetate kinase [Sulfitobacter sp. EhC04]|uniref:acetate/propionate family kinase n=1 Tax=Sulfitobacter sp. EhC04 TaxID=1849168 RepID=UPI0007F37B6A|nr:acetate/propionate family kinase [Sulfitobacter sp. EhC04]OAN78522.1 acetate kinase [Sulfitobacter sp. EhC04]
MPGPILVLNAGSSSIKCALFGAHFREMLRVEATGIGAQGAVKVNGRAPRALSLPDNAAALRAVADALAAEGAALDRLALVAHRVVHGSDEFTAPTRITDKVRAGIEACIPLAPLHNPHQLAAIDWIAQAAPTLPQVASFDTAFHATVPEVARRYALPDLPATRGLRRYGFHGNSYAALTRALPEMTGAPLPARLLALHLGNGASLCAIREGVSVATTMGYSPLGGLTMGTRVGVIDPGAVLELVSRVGLPQADQILSAQSGLLGLSGLSGDMRELAASDTPRAAFARDHFAYWAARQAGSMFAAMGGCDAIAFTGGIGENDADIRTRITELLRWAGDLPVHVVPAAEEAHIAMHAADLTGIDTADA